MKLIIYLFFFMTLSAQAEKYTVCAIRGLSEIDPGSSTDEMSSVIISLLDLTLFRKDGQASSVVKGFNFDESKQELTLELRTDIVWNIKDSFRINDALTVEDVVKSFNRYNQVRVIKDYYRGHAFRRFVSPYLKSVTKIDNKKILFKFSPDADFRKVLARPQSALVRGNSITWFKSHLVTGKFETGQFSIQTKTDIFDFKLNFSEEDLSTALVKKSCDLALRLGKVEAERLQRIYRISSKPEEVLHTVALIMNSSWPQLSIQTDRQLLANVFFNYQLKGELHNFTPLPTPEYVYKGPDVGKKLAAFTKKTKGKLLIMLPEQNQSKNIGLDSFYSNLSSKIEKLELNMNLRYVADEDTENELSHGHFHFMVNDIVDMNSYLSCYLDEKWHPVRSCGHPIEHYIKNLILVPLYEYRYYRAATNSKLLTLL